MPGPKRMTDKQLAANRANAQRKAGSIVPLSTIRNPWPQMVEWKQ